MVDPGGTAPPSEIPLDQLHTIIEIEYTYDRISQSCPIPPALGVCTHEIDRVLYSTLSLLAPGSGFEPDFTD